MSVVVFETFRTHYSAKEAAERTITVGDLIAALGEFDEDAPIVTSHDNGYTYGSISCNDIDIYDEDIEVEDISEGYEDPDFEDTDVD